MKNIARPFLGGLKTGTKGKAALDFLRTHEETVKAKSFTTITLRVGSRITETDLVSWAKRKGFNINPAGPNKFFVATAKPTLAARVAKVAS